MAHSSDSTIQFFKKASPEQWTYLLSCYKEAVGAKAQLRTKKGGPEQYLKLDAWYQDTLPKTIRSRKDPHLEYNELVDIMKWKLMRSKYKPAALDLVKTNTEKNVKATTQRAFKRMPKLEMAIQALTIGLKGIGTATASAILAAAFPDYAPYMAEECMVSTPDVEAEDYTQAEYLKYADHYQKFAKKLEEKDEKGDWNPHKVELAIWSHYVLRLHKPELLDKMPGQVESNGCGDEESNQAPLGEGQTLSEGQGNGISSSCDDDDSQQSNGTLNQDDSNSLPPHVTANGNGNGTPTAASANKNGHPESNTTDNDTRSSLVEDQDACCEESQDSQQPSQSSQPASDLEVSQDSSSVQTAVAGQVPSTGLASVTSVEAATPTAPVAAATGDIAATTEAAVTADEVASVSATGAVKRPADENGIGQDLHVDRDLPASECKKQKLDDALATAAAPVAESTTTVIATEATTEKTTSLTTTTAATTTTTTVAAAAATAVSDDVTSAAPVAESQ
ncbi:uncharacterized protein YMR317W-like [Varroa jacobsoni]|uniref:uncharacterized protein YMR317W-like n=1 Tax=Varroa jacobsoni TaxID=62625 RepID=UPI000BF6D09A|nr:uncharacterized protein YMR317W-like [Varroa jacobsoni]